MNREKKLVPKLRFPGFEGEWVEKRLGEVIEISSASRVHKHEWTESGVPFFRSSDVVANYKGTENTKAFISMDLFKKLSEKSGRVSKDDILLTGGGSIGIPYLINSDEPLYFKDADLLWLKTASIIDGQFLYAFFITLVFRKYINSISHIGTISHYTIEQAKETPICLPQKEEQQKIGTFFKQLDDSIALQQRKLSHLQAQKKGLLQKMFPKAGQALPELRFPGFEGKWEERKLGEIVDVRGGKDYKHLSEGNIPVYGTGGYMLSVNEALSYKENAIGIGRKGTIDKPYILKAPFWTVDTLFYAVPREDYDLDFVFNIFQIIDWKKKDESTGVPSLSKTAINAIVVIVPKENEQKVVGAYFARIDNLITLYQRKLEHLQTRKKALLQQMFV